MNNTDKGRLASGVVIMTLSGVVVKAAGLLFKIPLTALIGEEGMGYFNSAYTLFTWIYMLSCAGLPTAASMMIAKLSRGKREMGARQVLKTSLAVFLPVGVLGTVLLYFGAAPIASLMRVERAEAAICAIAPTLTIITVSSALRGYFQGFGEFVPHSVAQVIEALCKAGLGIILAHLAISGGKSVAETAAYAAFGITAGVLLGMMTLFFAYLIRRRHTSCMDLNPQSVSASRLVRLALPITVSSSVMSLAGLIDSFLMTRTLHEAGMSQSECAAVWGNYSTLAVPMFNLPPVLTMPIAYALLPSLTSAISVSDNERARSLTIDAVSRTAMLAVPCSVGLCAMSGPILSLLFENGVAQRGAMLLTLLAPSSMLLCMLSLFNTVLQAMGHERLPLVTMLSGAFVKLALTSILTPKIGVYATPVSTFLCYLTACTVAVLFISRCMPLSGIMGFKPYVLPCVLSGIAVTAAGCIYPFTGTLISVGVAAAVYFGLAAAVYGRGRIISFIKKKK